MALPKKTSRRILIDDRAYRWVTSHSVGINSPRTEGSAAFAVMLIVEAEGAVNSKIFDRVTFPKVDAYWDSWYVVCQDDSLVLPSHVAAVVKAAIADNWRPDGGANYQSKLLLRLIMARLPVELARKITFESPSPTGERSDGGE